MLESCWKAFAVGIFLSDLKPVSLLASTWNNRAEEAHDLFVHGTKVPVEMLCRL